jgi:hypothetical protein
MFCDAIGLLVLCSPKRPARATSWLGDSHDTSDGSGHALRGSTRHAASVKMEQDAGGIPALWVQMRGLRPIAPPPPPPARVGDLVSLHGVPGRCEGTGGEVVGIADSGFLELSLEVAELVPEPNITPLAVHEPHSRRLAEPPEVPRASGPVAPTLCVNPRFATTLPPYPSDGVSLAFLRAFRAAHSAELQGKTTSEVCKQLVKPATEQPRDSLAALLRRMGATDPQTGQPYAARATLFVSHAWRYSHTDLLDAIDAHAGHLPNPELVYVWLDVFSVNQHPTETMPMIWWTEMYARAICGMDSACLVLSPWHAPLPLQRAWCVWEAAAVEATQRPLHISMPPREAAACKRALMGDFAAVERLIWSVDVSLAQAHDPSERQLILRLIETRVGVTKLTHNLRWRLREWLVNAGLEALREVSTSDEEPHLLLSNVGRLLHDLGRLSEAEAMLRRAVSARLRLFGPGHSLTFLSQAQLADVLTSHGSHGEA